MNNKEKIIQQLRIDDIPRLYCFHDEDKPCKECLSKIRGTIIRTGNIANITGNITNIIGDISRINGNVSGIFGDVSKINGNVSGFAGDMTGIEGDISELRKILEENR